MTFKSNFFRDQSVLITGASSGLGEVFARRLAASGAHLVLTARRKEALEALARELSGAYGVRVRVIALDLGKPGAAHLLAREVREAGVDIDLLVNNAGFGAYGRTWALSDEDYEDMVRLNVEALTTLTRLFLPGMMERRRGGVINVGSTASFQPVPGFAVYGATKAYVLSFTEALAVELKGSGVRALALCPGPTKTGFQQRSGTQDMAPDWTYEGPEIVVERGLRAYEQGKAVKISGASNWMIAFAGRFFPRALVTAAAGLAMERARYLSLK